MSNFKKISTIKDLSMKIKSHPLAINQLKYRRGLIYLRKKNYKKAIDDFSDVIWRNKSEHVRGRRSLFIGKEKLYNTYLFRSFTFSVLKQFYNASADLSFLMKSDRKLSYKYFILFNWEVLENDTNRAIKYYYKFREISIGFLPYEKDLLTHLPFKKKLDKTIALINCSFGISS